MIFDLLRCVKLFLILTACSHCTCLEVSIPKPQYEVASGGDITLSCSFIPARPNYDFQILKWEIIKDNKAETLATFYNSRNHVDVAPDYEGRATLNVDPTNRVGELILKEVTMEDNGNFQCSVLIIGDDEGTTSATTFVLVLVPPSSPVCTIQGSAEYWNNITLTCMSVEGSPTPLYDWKSYSVENIPRPFPPKATQKDGLLSLFNISRDTSGFFICTSTNRIGSASCNLTLAVMPGGSMNVATVGIIGGVVAAVLVLAIIIYCCCRKKNKKVKYTDGAPGEMDFYDQDGADDSDNFREKKIQYNQEKDIDRTGIHKLNDMDSNADSHIYEGSHDRLDDNRDTYRGSRDRLDDNRDTYRGSRDRLDDNRDQYRGSRDRLEDNRDAYRGSRDRLDDNRDTYRGSRDRLDDNRDTYRGSRDRLDDNRDTYRGSRDRLDDNRDQYRGSRDRLEDNRDAYRGSRDRLDDNRDTYRGSRDRLDHSHHYGSREHLDYSESGQYD